MKYAYFILLILFASIMTSCSSTPTDKLKNTVEKMESIKINEITENNWEEFEASIQELQADIEIYKEKMTPEEIKEWHYWYGRYSALGIKRAFYPVSFLGENILKFAEGFMQGFGINTSEMEDGLKDGLNLFDNRK